MAENKKPKDAKENGASKTIDKRKDPEHITSNSMVQRGPARFQTINRPDNRPRPKE